MKKAFKKIISAMLAATMCFSVAACSPATPDGGDTDESVDTMRTQLYVYNFNGGFGTEWLKAAKTRFEAKHAEDELESGKKGVQVIIKANKDSNNGDTFWNNIPKAREEVYFVEGADYYKLVGSELMLDITDAVTSPSVRLHKGKEGYSYSVARRVVLRLCADDFQHVRSRLRGQRAVDAQLRIRQRNRKAGYVAG